MAGRLQAAKGADALAICTDWKKFRSLDFDWLKAQFAMPVVVDARNLFSPKAVNDAGLMYYAVGRGDSLALA